MESPSVQEEKLPSGMNIKALLARLFALSDQEVDRCTNMGAEMTGKTGSLSYRRKITIEKGTSTLKLFLKYSDRGRPDLGQFKDFSDHFCPRECLFYGCLAPLLERTAAQLGIGSIGLPTVHQELVLPTGTLIVMEDLCEAGFELAPAVMNADEARCVLSSLARVQAAFWLTRARLGGQADALFGPASPLRYAFRSLSEIGTSIDEMLSTGFDLFRREFIKHLKCEKRVAIINAYLNHDFLVKARTIMKSSLEETEVVGVNHSDLWHNNCMLRRDASGQPMECRIIDWQAFGIGWLTNDLGPLWLCSIRNELVIEAFMACVDFYHHSVQSVYESALSVKFPVSLDQTRRQAVQSLNWGVFWMVMYADFIGTFSAVDNLLANMADLIEHFKL